MPVRTWLGMALKDSAMMLFVERDGGRMMISDLIQRWSVEVVKFNLTH